MGIGISEKEILTCLEKTGAVITDSHIVYTSGMHGSAYINKDAMYPHVRLTNEITKAIAYEFDGAFFDTVISPAVGAIILGQGVALHRTVYTGSVTTAVYAEKETVALPDPGNQKRVCYAETGNFIIKRGYDKFVTGKRVLVMEDILNTGGSAKKVVEAVRAIGGVVVAVAALVNRGGVTAADLGDVPRVFSLLNLKMDAWPAHECPLCARSVPINTDVGHGKAFLAKKAEATV